MMVDVFLYTLISLTYLKPNKNGLQTVIRASIYSPTLIYLTNELFFR